MTRRVAAILAANVVLVLLVLPAAHATAASARVANQAWAQTGPISTFQAQQDHIYVAATAAIEEARSYVRVVVEELPESALSGARLVLTEGTDGLMNATAAIVACALSAPLTHNGKLAGQFPPLDCTLRVEASRDEDGRWTVELGTFAQRWTKGYDHGLALTPAGAGPTETFRVAFDTMKTSLEGVALPAVVASEPETARAVADESPTAASDPGSDVTFGSVARLDEAGLVGSPTTPEALLPAGQDEDEDIAASALTNEGTEFALQPGASVNSPPVVVGFGILGAVTLVGIVTLAAPPFRRKFTLPTRLQHIRGETRVGAVAFLTVIGLALLPMTASELAVYKWGLVLIFIVAALGLHVLVNWGGQLSLAHAAMVGLPAFVVLAISDIHHVSPLYLLPVGLVTGAVTGAVVALPTLRARGLQVTLVTLLAGIAIDRFFFTKTWLVGSAGGRAAATPALGPFEFESSRSLYPVLLVLVGLTVFATWILLHSKPARAWFWVRANPAAAAAFGVPVVTYRIFAFGAGGALGGLAGALTVCWVRQLTAGAFPTGLSFTYLLVAVLSGPGFAGGIAVAALVLEGGRLFSSGSGGDTAIAYLGPIALILTITQYEAGLNGTGRSIMNRLKQFLPKGGVEEGAEPEPISLGLIGGVVAILAGFIAIIFAWYHAGNTNQLWVQNQELISGGVGGLALVFVGVGLLIRDRLSRNQARLERALRALGSGQLPVAEPATVSENGPPARRARRVAKSIASG